MPSWWTSATVRERILAALVAAIVLLGAITAIAALASDGGDGEPVTAGAGSTSTTSASTSSSSSSSSSTSASASTTSSAAPAATSTSSAGGRGGTAPTTATTRRGGAGATTTTAPAPATTATTRPSSAGPCSPSSSGAAGQLAELFCARRADRGLPAMRRTAALDAVAQEWAQKLAADHALSHRSSADLKARVLAACSGCTGWAENVAFSSSPGALWAAWLGSDTHRQNIDDPHAGEFGIGTAVGDDGYLYAVQNFGRYP